MHERNTRASEAFLSLLETMTRLRAPGGCPWDREQTMRSLRPYLLEEAYEVLDAMEQQDAKAHCEELGDLLLQIVFQAEIAQETSLFDMAQIAQSLNDKLKRRHPDVFPDSHAAQTAVAVVTSSGQALNRWEQLKAQERGQRKGRLSGVPKAMPALLRAMRTSEKAASAGFDWPDLHGAWDKVKEEIGEFEAACTQPGTIGQANMTEEMGDLLFSLVNVCRKVHIDAEAALRQTLDKFQHRFEHVEQALNQSSQTMETTDLATLNRLWEQAKTTLGKTSIG